jgi:uncharacterized protein (TIGR00730 family)
MTVGIFASSSGQIDPHYSVVATELGKLLARAEVHIVFGGGGIGLMGALADSSIREEGKITGVIPSFMKAEGWDHSQVKDMIYTTDMGSRKKKIFELSQAIIALPGGVGTLEELTEAITLKQLGLFKGPIIILNTLNYYDHLLKFLDHMIDGNFMRFEHAGIWQVVNTPEEAIDAIFKYGGWIPEPRKIARI